MMRVSGSQPLCFKWNFQMRGLVILFLELCFLELVLVILDSVSSSKPCKVKFETETLIKIQFFWMKKRSFFYDCHSRSSHVNQSSVFWNFIYSNEISWHYIIESIRSTFVLNFSFFWTLIFSCFNYEMLFDLCFVFMKIWSTNLDFKFSRKSATSLMKEVWLP